MGDASLILEPSAHSCSIELSTPAHLKMTPSRSNLSIALGRVQTQLQAHYLAHTVRPNGYSSPIACVTAVVGTQAILCSRHAIQAEGCATRLNRKAQSRTEAYRDGTPHRVPPLTLSPHCGCLIVAHAAKIKCESLGVLAGYSQALQGDSS